MGQLSRLAVLGQSDLPMADEHRDTNASDPRLSPGLCMLQWGGGAHIPVAGWGRFLHPPPEQGDLNAPCQLSWLERPQAMGGSVTSGAQSWSRPRRCIGAWESGHSRDLVLAEPAAPHGSPCRAVPDHTFPRA